ncbi:MAG: phosphotransferase [Patescibacteria group bacterium]
MHYDLNPNNILIDAKGQVIFLDWRQASIGDRAMDIAKFFYKNYLNERQRELFFKIYLDDIEDPTIIFRTATYYPLIVLSSLLWRLRFLNIDIKEHPDIENQADIELVRDRLKDDYEYLMSITRL